MRIGLYVNGGAHEREQVLRIAARSLGHELAVRNGALLVAADFESDFDAVLTDEDCADAVRALYADRSVPGDRMWRAGRPVVGFSGDEDPAELIAIVAGKASAPAPEPSPKAAAVADALAKLDEGDAPPAPVDVPVAAPKGKAKR